MILGRGKKRDRERERGGGGGERLCRIGKFKTEDKRWQKGIYKEKSPRRIKQKNGRKKRDQVGGARCSDHGTVCRTCPVTVSPWGLPSQGSDTVCVSCSSVALCSVEFHRLTLPAVS